MTIDPVFDVDIDPDTDPGTGTAFVVPQTSSPTSLSLITADGTEFDLANWPTLTATLGRKGFDAVSYTAYTDESPNVDGEVFRSARALPRDMIVPIYLRGNTRSEFLAAKRNLLAKLSPIRGMATLEVAEEDGTRRRIGVYFTGRGAEGDAARDQAGRNWVKYNLELRAPDPYWRGDLLTLQFQATSVDSFFPILPLRVQSAQRFGNTSFTNPGDVFSYPLWTITGPTAGGVILTRTTSGLPSRVLRLNITLAGGETVVVDTNPERLSIVDGYGVNRWPTLVAGSAFWQVSPGTNALSVVITGAGTGSKVKVDIEPRYETA